MLNQCQSCWLQSHMVSPQSETQLMFGLLCQGEPVADGVRDTRFGPLHFHEPVQPVKKNNSPH